MNERCPVCGEALPPQGSFGVRYEQRVYRFDKERCKRIFQENPDRYLDAGGGVLDVPR